MSTLKSTSIRKTDTKSPLSLYDRYGAMAYGVILQIVPQEHLAQEILVDLFNFSSLLNCNEGVSEAICIIRHARSKALEFSNRFKSLLQTSGDNSLVESDSLPKAIFDLAFKQGLTIDIIAVKLGLSKEATMKAISQHVKSFRQS
jgi:hypothetical protein